MKWHFFKYQGTGNDFVILDDREARFPIDDVQLITKLCDRKFGIGADGLMLLRLHNDWDFEMVYFNSDGRQSSMCGNGGRCITAFAHRLGVISNACSFIAIDGPHDARILKDGQVSLKMVDVNAIEKIDSDLFLDTGSPHFIRFVENVNAVDVVAEGRGVRYNDRFREEGTNVNFVQKTAAGIRMRTYERGVEDETLSCGTGVTAAVLASGDSTAGQGSLDVETQGGNLKVHYRQGGENEFSDIWLQGPATFVFEGEIEV